MVPAERSIGWDILTDTAIGLLEARRGRVLRRADRGRPWSARWPTCWPSARAQRWSSRAGTPGGGRAAREARADGAGCGSSAGARRSCSAARSRAGGPAIRELRDAELALDEGGAHAHRDDARRELRKLGHRVDQIRRRAAPTDALGGLAARRRASARSSRSSPRAARTRRSPRSSSCRSRPSRRTCATSSASSAWPHGPRSPRRSPPAPLPPPPPPLPRPPFSPPCVRPGTDGRLLRLPGSRGATGGDGVLAWAPARRRASCSPAADAGIPACTVA